MSQLAHAASFQNIPGCRLTALAELRPELRQRVGERFGFEQTYPSHLELLEHGNVDAVVVVTRRHATGPVVQDCLKAGKHVLSEKPMAYTAQQADMLVSDAAAADKQYVVGYMKRYDPGVALAKEFIEQSLAGRGELGRPIHGRVFCYAGNSHASANEFVMTDEPRPDGLNLWPVAPDWLPKSLWNSYDDFSNVHSHDINLMRYLFGEPNRLDYADMTSAVKQGCFAFPGFTVALEAGKVESDTWLEGVEVMFERGRLNVCFPPPMLKYQPAEVRVLVGGKQAEERRIAASWGWSYALQAEAFVDDLIKGRRSRSTGADSARDLGIIEELWATHPDTGK